MLCQVTVRRAFKLQNPPLGWPRTGAGGEEILVPYSIGRGMEGEGLADVTLIEESKAYDSPGGKLRKLEARYDKAKADAEAISQEMNSTRKRIEELKLELKTAPLDQIRSLESEMVACERAMETLMHRRREATNKLMPLQSEYRFCVLQQALSDAETALAGSLRMAAERFIDTAFTESEQVASAVETAAKATGSNGTVPTSLRDPVDLLTEMVARVVAERRGLRQFDPGSMEIRRRES